MAPHRHAFLSQKYESLSLRKFVSEAPPPVGNDWRVVCIKLRGGLDCAGPLSVVNFGLWWKSGNAAENVAAFWRSRWLTSAIAVDGEAARSYIHVIMSKSALCVGSSSCFLYGIGRKSREISLDLEGSALPLQESFVMLVVLVGWP